MTMDDNPGSFDVILGDVASGLGPADLGLSAGFGDSLDMPLGLADQACKECRRRKSKCNKQIPTCNLCVKYKRHCLYEKHSRTPLTRKHLTEVEERLERAEALIRQMRTFLPPHLQSSKNASPASVQRLKTTSSDPSFDFTKLDQPVAGAGGTVQAAGAGEASSSAQNVDEDAPYDLDSGSDPGSSAPNLVTPKVAETQDTHQSPQKLAPYKIPQRGMSTILETPPATDDFEWDEQDTMTTASWSPVNGNEPDEAALDGMASLAVNEREAGYLGVASGAALLRLLEPSIRSRSSHTRSRPSTSSYSLTSQPNPNRHIADSMIDAYFSLFHINYPIIHEPTFRAQYSEVIPRPNGDSWLVLAYVVAALGVFTTATTLDNLDLDLFARARSILSFNFLELGNLTLVQALTLMSNYQQKRDRPNSGYNYLGLAVRMAMGLGLHKEFQGWNISPLNMEIRRRVWWSLCVFDCGATVTFSRPLTWPFDGVEVSLPINVNDRELTPNSATYPPESDGITPYTSVRAQAAFHLATNPIYTRVIGKPLPSAEELLELDKERIEPWLHSVPACFAEGATVPSKYRFAHAELSWRYRNFRIIMYRPFVIRRALHARDGRRDDSSPASIQAYDTCLGDAKYTIESISELWTTSDHHRLGAWYALYFLFQAALIPCICLRNMPVSDQAADWRRQITSTLQAITAFAPVSTSAARCYGVIAELCGRYLDSPPPPFPHTAYSSSSSSSRTPPQQVLGGDGGGGGAYGPYAGPQPSDEYRLDEMMPIDESPQTQMNNMYSMMWPNVPPIEAADFVMGNDAWMDFLRGDEAAQEQRRSWYGQ